MEPQLKARFIDSRTQPCFVSRGNPRDRASLSQRYAVDFGTSFASARSGAGRLLIVAWAS